METYQSVRTLDLKHLLFRIMKNWYWLAGAAGFGAIAVPLVRFLKLRIDYSTQLKAFKAGTANVIEPVAPSFPFLYILIGLFVGVVVALLVFWAIELFDNTLKSAAELTRPEGVQVLAEIKTSREGKKERTIRKLLKMNAPRPEKKETELLCAKLVAASRNRKYKSIVVAGKLEGKATAIVKTVIDVLTQAEVGIEYVGDILQDPRAILKLNSEVGVVLVETVGKTTYQTLDGEIAECRNQKADLLGFLVTE